MAKSPAAPMRIIFLTAILIAVIIVLLLAFSLPRLHSEVRHLPVSIVASTQQKALITTALDKVGEEAFTYHSASSEAAAKEQILDREVYGAFIVTPEGITLHYASAASAEVAATLTTVAQQFGATMNVPVNTNDLRSFSAQDPKGIGLATGALPLALGGWIAAAVIIRALRDRRQRLYVAGAFVVCGGFAMTAVLHGIGTLSGNYLADSLAAMLGLAATSFLVLGLEGAFKRAGIGIAAVLLIFLGYPLSGLGSAPELLPYPWGTLGQLLPPGATGTLLRNVSFFDGAAIARPALVLAFWSGLGLLLYTVGMMRASRGKEHAPAGESASPEAHTGLESSSEAPQA